MKVLILELNEKKYTTVKITAYLSKQALLIQKEALALAKLGKEVQSDVENIEAIEKLLDELDALKDRKTNLICQVYDNKFTVDELEKCLSDEEIDSQVNGIISGICGVISKN